MKKISRVITIAALGLCLAAIQAWAEFQLINSSGGTIKAGCTGTTSSRDISNGSTAGFICTGTLHLQLTEANATSYTVTDTCPSDDYYYHTTTASAGTSAGALSLAHHCETGASANSLSCPSGNCWE